MYSISVKTNDGWRLLKPTNGTPYRYPTKDKARAIARMCYPDAYREQLFGGEVTVRIVPSHDDVGTTATI
jgi:hypothetical protein